MPTKITSRENAQIKQAVQIASSGAQRRESGLFFAETGKLVLDLAAFGATPHQVFYTEEALGAYPSLATLPGEHFLVMPHVAEKLSGQKTPSGVYMLAQAPVFTGPLFRTDGRYLALERVQDPANVGGALRTAAAMGFDGVFLTKDCADPFSQKALRASMGAAVKMPIHYVGNMAQWCRQLAERGIEPVAAALENAVDINTYTPTGGVAVLVGSEGQGLSPAVMEAASVRLRIPMASNTESLNASVAAAIFMWHLRRPF